MTAGSPSASPTGVWVLGGYQRDFARNLTREGRDVSDLVGEVVDGTLEAATSPQPTSRSSTSATPSASCSPVRVSSARCRRPSCRRCGACRPRGTRPPARRAASALLAAMADLEAGRYDCALVARRRAREDGRPATRPPRTSARPPGSATRARAHLHVAAHVRADRRRVRPALRARRRPPARDRGAQPRATPGATPTRRPAAGRSRRQLRRDDDEANPVVEGRIRRYDCSQVTDGAAGVVLVSRRASCATTRRRRPDGAASRAGVTAPSGLPLAAEARPRPRRARTSCRTCAGPSPTRSTGPDVDARATWTAIEMHDCFTPSEYLAIDHIGLTGPGESWKAVEDGDIELRRPAAGQPERWSDRRRPPGGGDRRPHARSTPRKQVSGTAGDYQVEGARTLRHAQLRRQHRHDRQPRRRRGPD